MSIPLKAVDDLAAAAARLRKAMEASDVTQIESEIETFRRALTQVQDMGAWRADPILKKRVEDLLPQLDSSRMLARLLGDLTGQRIAKVSAQNGDVPHPLYSRTA